MCRYPIDCRFLTFSSGISFGLAGLISTTATVANNYTPTPGKTIAIYLAILLSHVFVNAFGVKTLRYLNNTSIFLHCFGIFALSIAVVAKAPTHRSAKEVFAFFYDGTGVGGPGWSERASPSYVAIIGILMAQYSKMNHQCVSCEPNHLPQQLPASMLVPIYRKKHRTQNAQLPSA